MLIGALALVACGKRGDPLPPIRRTPQPVTDFRVAERGDQLEASLLAPRAFTDGSRMPVLEVEILRAGPEGTFVKVAQSTVRKAAPGERIVIDEPLPPIGTALRLSARARVKGRSSSQTPIVTVTITATPPAPTGPSARSSEKGVTLSWTPPEMESPSFFVYRRSKVGDYGLPLLDNPITEGTWVDDKALPGDSWCYVIRTVSSTSPLVESAATDESCLVVEDVAAPAIPLGVAVQPREGGLEVSWSPSPEPDLATYRVYRWSQGVPVARIAEVPAGETAYLDSSAPTGIVVRYGVTAVDKSGNESGRSPGVAASRP
ncbi:MAG: fibronectin type III domain-containing protein [Vicinamibacteria bacterium]